MNLWSHRFSPDTNKKLLKFMPSLSTRVSNGTGQCNFLGQRDRSSFIVAGQSDNGTSPRSCHRTGQAGKACQNRGQDVGWDNHYFSVKIRGMKINNFVTCFSENGIKLQNWKFFFFWQSDFVLGRLGTEEVVLGFLLLPLPRDKGTEGQGNIFVPGPPVPWKG